MYISKFYLYLLNITFIHKLIVLNFIMPFKSKEQVRTCYYEKSKNPKSTWNCDKWLSETECIKSLPYEKNGKAVKCRQLKKGEKIRGAVKIGSRGGLYFEIKEAGKIVMKVYLPHTEANMKRYAKSYLY